eukprot:UN15169
MDSPVPKSLTIPLVSDLKSVESHFLLCKKHKNMFVRSFSTLDFEAHNGPSHQSEYPMQYEIIAFGITCLKIFSKPSLTLYSSEG